MDEAIRVVISIVLGVGIVLGIPILLFVLSDWLSKKFKRNSSRR